MDITKESAIKFLKEKEKIDVEELLSDAEELKLLSDRIDKGELISKEDAALLSDETIKKIKDQLKLGDDVKKVEDIVKSLLERFASMAGMEAKVTNLGKELSSMKAEKEMTALLSEGFALPSEKEVLTKLYLKDSELFSETAKVRRAGKKLVELGEKGVQEMEQQKTKEKEEKEAIDRNVKAAKAEGYIRE